MKRCSECGRDYNDDSLRFCLDDGAVLLFGPAATDEPATAIFGGFGVPPSGGSSSESATRTQLHTTPEAQPPISLDNLSERPSLSAHRAAKPLVAFVIAAIVLVGGSFGYRYFSSSNSKQIESIAVMP